MNTPCTYTFLRNGGIMRHWIKEGEPAGTVIIDPAHVRDSIQMEATDWCRYFNQKHTKPDFFIEQIEPE